MIKISANRSFRALFDEIFVTQFGDIVAKNWFFKVDAVKFNKKQEFEDLSEYLSKIHDILNSQCKLQQWNFW